MDNLQQADPVLRKYIMQHSLPEIYKALLSGLCVVCPANPLQFLEEKIKEFQENGNWGYTCVQAGPKAAVTEVAGSYLQGLFGFSENNMFLSHLFEKAYTHYRKSLMRMCFNAWIKFIFRKQAQASEQIQKMNIAEDHYVQTRLKLTLHKWIEWLQFQKKRQADAMKKIQGVWDLVYCKRVFRAWRYVVQDSKKTKEYFERLERGQLDPEFDHTIAPPGESRDELSQLPRRAALKIFTWLGIKDLARCAQVCRSWKMLTQNSSLWSQINFSSEKYRIADGTVVRLLQKYRPFVIHLNFHGCSSLQWPSFQCISECRNLQDLNLSECTSVNDETMRLVLEGCPTLLYLNVSCTGVTNGTLRVLARCCLNLQYLSLAYCRKFTDKGLQYLATGKGCHKLIYLDLSGCTQAVVSKCHLLRTVSLLDTPHPSDTAFKAIAEVCKLKQIKIEGNSRMTDTSWKAFCKSSPCLSHIYAADCPKITDISLKAIGALKNLTVLNVADCIRVSDTGVRYLVEGPSAGKIRELNLTNCVRVSDVSLLRIAQRCNKLTQLSLCYCEHLTDSGIEWLSGLSSLIHIDLSGTNIQDQSLAALGNNTGIKKLTVSECLWITDVGIEKFCKQVRDLECMDVSHCISLTDQTIKALAFYCRTIISLNISGCPKMTDMCIQYLTGACHYLRELDVSGCVRLSDKTPTFLHKGCQQLKVLKMMYCRGISRQAALKMKPRIRLWQHSDDDPPSWFGYNSQGELLDSTTKPEKTGKPWEEEAEPTGHRSIFTEN
nr:PREDICTED: F-box/LRR-repeat protein 13 isoform X3 [Lepisosteus oculatus]